MERTDKTAELPPTADRSTDENLAGVLAAAAPRRWRNGATMPLAAALLALAGFVGGLAVPRETADATTLPGGTAPRQGGGFPGGAGFPSGGAAPGADGRRGGDGTGQTGTAAPTTAGKVKLVDGTTVYVETADGTLVTVKTSSDTRVLTATSLNTLKPGDSVTVAGASDAQGTVTATQVTKGGS